MVAETSRGSFSKEVAFEFRRNCERKLQDVTGLFVHVQIFLGICLDYLLLFCVKKQHL